MDDTSFMNTEPLDISTFDTEPLDVDMGTSAEEEEEVSDTDPGIESCDGDDDTSRRRTCLDFSEIDGGSGTMSNDDDDEPQIDISMAASYEVKRIYSDLIDSCRGFSDDTFSDNSERILKENITTGDVLFRQMGESLSQSLSGNQSDPKGYVPRGNSVSELHLACQHTKMCCIMLKQAVKNLGAASCIFKFEDFMDYLRRASVDNTGTYSALVAVRKLAVTANSAFYTAPEYFPISGCIEKDNFVQPAKQADQKEQKVRMPRIKKEEGNEENADEKPDATETEISKESTSEVLAKDVMKAVKTKYKAHNTPQRMLEIVHADNVSQVISKLFGVAFVVRDGLVGVTRDGGRTAVDSSLALMLTPEKPPEKAGNAKDDKHRNQYIASFSSKLLKELVESGKVGK